MNNEDIYIQHRKQILPFAYNTPLVSQFTQYLNHIRWGMITNCQMVWLWGELFMAYTDKVKKIRRNVRHNSKQSDHTWVCKIVQSGSHVLIVSQELPASSFKKYSTYVLNLTTLHRIPEDSTLYALLWEFLPTNPWHNWYNILLGECSMILKFKWAWIFKCSLSTILILYTK